LQIISQARVALQEWVALICHRYLCLLLQGRCIGNRRRGYP